MNDRPSSSFRAFIAPTLTLFLLGWGGWVLTVLFLRPLVWARWLFFFTGFLGLTGLALPAAWFLNRRFPSNPPAESYVVVRQAIWFGVYGTLLAWLQSATDITLWVALGLALGLVAIEYIIRMRERARWQPPSPQEPENSPPATEGE